MRGAGAAGGWRGFDGQALRASPSAKGAMHSVGFSPPAPCAEIKNPPGASLPFADGGRGGGKRGDCGTAGEGGRTATRFREPGTRPAPCADFGPASRPRGRPSAPPRPLRNPFARRFAPNSGISQPLPPSFRRPACPSKPRQPPAAPASVSGECVICTFRSFCPQIRDSRGLRCASGECVICAFRSFCPQIRDSRRVCVMVFRQPEGLTPVE